jgi:gliding motility-associatede transport system auxiliary component
MLKRIIGVIGWVGTALVLGAVVIRLFRPEFAKYGYWAAWAGLACVIVYMVGQWRDVATSMSERQTRLSTITVLSVVLVLGLLSAVNYLASRRNHRWDLTANSQFSLSPQTKQILEKLDAPVKVRVYEQADKTQRFRDRLDDYQYSSKQVSVEYIDPDKQNVRAVQDQVQTYGTVVFEYKGRKERVVSSDEQQLTNGLIKLITGQERKVYFLQGHGEKQTTGQERDSYSSIVSALGSENFKVETLVLLQQEAVPADATAVVIAGPKTDLFQPEIDALRKYLAGGGKLLVMIDPPAKPESPPLANLIGFVKEWGIDVGNNIVVDVSSIGRLLGTDASVPVAPPPYPNHPITKDFRLVTAYPVARSVSASASGANGRVAQNFIQTSASSWGETDLAGMFKSGKVENDKTKDLQGPVSLAAAASEPVKEAQPAKTSTNADKDAPKPETRIAVIGDSDFAANYALGIEGNRDMFMNTLNWLAQQENLISIRPKDADDRRITLTADQQKWVAALTLLILPATVFGLGIYNWARRRG